jgi:hypothetical protein
MISTGTLGLMLSSVFLQLYSALFEVAIDVLKRAKNLGEPASILEAIVATDYHSVVGPIKWSGKPVRMSAKHRWLRANGESEAFRFDSSTRPYFFRPWP